jgi:hypothetical protein
VAQHRVCRADPGAAGAVSSVRLWPAIALVGAYELLTMIIRRVQVPTAMPSLHDDACVADPLDERAAQVFAVELAADRVPSIRSIRATLHVGQRRTQRLSKYLATTAKTHKRRPHRVLRLSTPNSIALLGTRQGGGSGVDEVAARPFRRLADGLADDYGQP